VKEPSAKKEKTSVAPEGHPVLNVSEKPITRSRRRSLLVGKKEMILQVAEQEAAKKNQHPRRLIDTPGERVATEHQYMAMPLKREMGSRPKPAPGRKGPCQGKRRKKQHPKKQQRAEGRQRQNVVTFLRLVEKKRK